jgi:diguanylate cyclase (GGDEF)-like protein
MGGLLSGLERSAPYNRRLDALVGPALKAESLARHGRLKRARDAFAGLSASATAAASAEADPGAPGRSGILIRLQDGSAAIAAVLGALVGLVALIALPAGRRDRTVRELSQEARTDNLTGLHNQRAFQETLSQAISRRDADGTPFVVLAIDLDGLKQINDARGHLAGDTRIKEVANCIKQVVGQQGLVHRTGGDEFMVVLPGRRNIHGLTIARRIDEETRRRFGSRAVSIGLTESIAAEGRLLIVGQADLALYEAKRTSLNAVVFNPRLARPVDPIDRRQSGPSPEQRARAATLARALDAKEAGARSHSETVAALCVAIGERLGVSGHQLERLRLAGLLHDVGKLGIADELLRKPHALDGSERAEVAGHVQIGHSILVSAELPIEAEWVLHHHERYDGTGYPAGKSAAEIPLESRIIAVADAFEALTADRSNHPGLTPHQALEELQRNAGTQFDARCVDALLDAIADDGAASVRRSVSPV